MKPKLHSRISVISFFCSILSIIAFAWIFLVLFLGNRYESKPELVVNAAIVCFGVMCGAAVLAVLLGAVALFQKQKKRIFGVLGFIFGLLEVTGISASIFLIIKFLEILGKALGSGFGKM
jgi:hypothetical protein